MTAMTLQDLADHARKDKSENLVKLLKAYGHEDGAVQAIQDGVDGHWVYTDGSRLWSVPFNVTDKAAKDGIMADFRSSQGAFAPQPPPPTPDALKEIRAAIAELTNRFSELEKKLGISAPATTAPNNDTNSRPPSSLAMKFFGR